MALENYLKRGDPPFPQGPRTNADPPPISVDLMERINQAQGRVLSRDLLAHYLNQGANGVDQVELTVRDLEASLAGPPRVNEGRVICFIPAGGAWDVITDDRLRAAIADGHCIVPTRIEYARADRDLDGARIYVYDNNYPGIDSCFIQLSRRPDGKLGFAYGDPTSPPPRYYYDPDEGYTLGIARLQEQLFDDVDVPFAEVEGG